jgi:hypothetical protein
MARSQFSDHSTDQMKTEIQESNCVALYDSDDGERPVWIWNPVRSSSLGSAAFKWKPLDLIVGNGRLAEAKALVMQVKQTKKQPN